MFFFCSRSNKCGVECRKVRGWDYAGELDRDFILDNKKKRTIDNSY